MPEITKYWNDTAYTNQVDPAHLLQVIRDMDRRITDLERKLEQNGRQL